MIYILPGEEEGVSELLHSLKKSMHKNVRKEKHKYVREEGEGQKLAKIYLKGINFRMDKILRTATSVDFCVV